MPQPPMDRGLLGHGRCPRDTCRQHLGLSLLARPHLGSPCCRCAANSIAHPGDTATRAGKVAGRQIIKRNGPMTSNAALLRPRQISAPPTGDQLPWAAGLIQQDVQKHHAQPFDLGAATRNRSAWPHFTAAWVSDR